jgi:hypothetical protein
VVWSFLFGLAAAPFNVVRLGDECNIAVWGCLAVIRESGHFLDLW